MKSTENPRNIPGAPMKVVSGNPDPNHVSGTEVGWKARSEAHQRADLQSCSGARASVGRLKID